MKSVSHNNQQTLIDLVGHVTHLARGLLEIQVVLAPELLAVAGTVPNCLKALDALAFHQREFDAVGLVRVCARARAGALQDVAESLCLHF